MIGTFGVVGVCLKYPLNNVFYEEFIIKNNVNATPFMKKLCILEIYTSRADKFLKLLKNILIFEYHKMNLEWPSAISQKQIIVCFWGKKLPAVKWPRKIEYVD